MIINFLRMKFPAAISFFLSCLILTSFSGEMNPVQYTDHVSDERIKTVKLFKEGWDLSYPVIKSGSGEKLILQFDLLGTNIETFYYTFIHCNKDWKRSDIFPNEYLDGFPENPIEDYNYSFNTTVDYIHYHLSFPNDRVSLKLSGNYIISVYQVDEPDKPVITKRFIITEDAAAVEINMHRPRMTRDTETHQQIDFRVNISGLNIRDPHGDIYATILQNGRWNVSRANLKPDFFSDRELRFSSLSENNIFPGGNEFRYFDIRSIRYLSEFVKAIDYLAPYYHVYLHPSESREFKPYFYWQDFNGKYIIAVQEGQNHDTDADYVHVYFTLPSAQALPGGKMYVSGSFNNWSLDAGNQMFYNPGSGSYECIIILKQGWYNYEYVFRKDDPPGEFSSKFEGTHIETENDYTVIVYYRNPRDRYDRILAAITANTLNRITD